MEVYIKLFTQRGKPKRSSTDKYGISSWFPAPMSKAFFSNYGTHIRETDWIIGPLYEEGDFQIGVTGTLETHENYREAMARELGEEVGILPQPTGTIHDDLNQFIEIGAGKTKYGSRLKVYRLYIKDAMLVPKYQHLTDLSVNHDDKTRKSGCFVYGAKKDILALMSNELYHYKSPDEIVGVAAIQARSVYNFMTTNPKD
uniref:Uncharacterized protein n=1 Tax=viral metagenome TaxID=1070528 RepID=A0A6C0EQ32_9ZZZZ